MFNVILIGSLVLSSFMALPGTATAQDAAGQAQVAADPAALLCSCTLFDRRRGINLALELSQQQPGQYGGTVQFPRRRHWLRSACRMQMDQQQNVTIQCISTLGDKMGDSGQIPYASVVESMCPALAESLKNMRSKYSYASFRGNCSAVVQ